MHVRTPCVGTLGGLQTAPDVVVGPRREWRKPKPVMNGLKKSDEAVRPVRAANKGARASAESPEERVSTKGNPERQSTRRTQCRASVPQAAARIRKAAERNPKERLTALFHYITPDALHRAFHALRRNAVAGVDGVTWDMYGEGLEERLLDLHRRLHRGGAYRAPPVRRVEIPKPDGGTRPLGIAALEDKVVQKAVVDVILTPIYEVEFLGFSYGFRPGRGAHDALDALAFGIERRKVSWIVDADLRAYFDTIPRDWLIAFVEHRIGDRRVIRLIRKWLNAGVMDGGSWTDAGMGTPQGAIVSPVLANVFLHYVLDLWFHKKWRPNVPDGEASIVRYADDIVVGFQHKRDAERYLRDVRARLSQFGLSLHQDKTRLVEFGRFAVMNRRQRGVGKPETFDFLGFMHYCTTTRRGRFRLGRKPIAKRVNRTLARIDEVLRKRWHHDIWEVGRWLGRVCEGWLNYFAVPGSGRFIRAFHRRLQRLWMRALRRRSQRARFGWRRLERMTEILWPRVSIRHPWPDQRFAVNHPR